MADDLYVELDTRPDRGDGPKRKYYFRCRCDICVEDERGFTLQLYQRIWRGVTTTDKLTWEPQSYRSTGGEKDTRGHLRKSLDRYHQNRLKPVQKNAEGQMNDATKQALKALKDRILVCWNDQSGTDTWWRNAYSSRIQTAAGIETDHDGDDRDGDDHDTWSAGQPQSSPYRDDDQTDPTYMPGSPQVPGPEPVAEGTSASLSTDQAADHQRGATERSDQATEGEQEEGDDMNDDEGDDMNDDEGDDEDREVALQAYVELEAARPTPERPPEPTDPSRVQDHFLVALGQVFGEQHVPRLMRALCAAHGKGLSRAGLDEVGRVLTESDSCLKGRSIIPLLNKLRLPTEKSFTCIHRHELYEDKESTCSTCQGGGAREGRAANPGEQAGTMERHSVRLALPVVFQHFMQQQPFAESIRSGPEVLKNSIQRQERRGPDETLRSVWESPRMHELHNKVGMTCTNGRIPVAVEFFTDGVMPTKSHGQDMWVVLMKVLNLPLRLANDYIVPVTIVGSKKKPSSIDVYLRRLVDEMGRSITVPDISKPDKNLALDLYLFCSAQDSMAMPLVAHHMCFPGNFACHHCFVKADRIKKPTAKTAKGGCPVYPATDAQGRPFPSKDDTIAQMINEYCDKATVKSVGTGIQGYKGSPPFAALWANGHHYFGPRTGFLSCVMHLVLNEVKRGWEHVQGSSTWSAEDLAKWLQTEEGRQCQARYEREIDPGNPPWLMNKWPNRDRVDPKNRDAGLAFEAASHTRAPSNLHGTITLLLHKKNKSKANAELSYSRSIKAAEWHGFAISGVISYLEALAGVDPRVVAARAGLYRALKTLSARHVRVDEVKQLDEEMPGIIKRLSDLAPPIEQTISLHGFVHLPWQVLHFGPFVFIWSYPFESYFAFLKPVAQLNHACPDTTGMSRVATQLGMQGWVVSQASQTIGPTKAAPTQDELWPTHPQITALYRGSQQGKVRGLNEHFPGRSAIFLVSAVEEFYRSRTFHNMPRYRQVIQSLNDDHVTILYYDRLTIGDVQVQGVDNQCIATDNGWLFLRKTETQGLPRLAHVQAIYRVEIRQKSDASTGQARIIEDRLLLHVAEYCLCEVDGELMQCGLQQFMHICRCDQTPVHRLIDVSSIDEQAIRMPDPRYPDGDGYHQYVVMDKGTWQNMDLKNPFLPSLTLKST